jgi:hypothetical protein
MEQIGIRELRQHASRWLEPLIASGRLIPGRGHLSDLGMPPPPPPDAPLPSEVLEQMRADER